jgi:hypothetical protein
MNQLVAQPTDRLSPPEPVDWLPQASGSEQPFMFCGLYQFLLPLAAQ